MPLLKRKPFVPQPLPPGFKEDEKYFVCQPTGEVFKNYQDFFDRVIICNSVVWTCSVTGRPGLTYLEAVACERKSLAIIDRFPEELRRPTLYLTTLTCRTRINDVNDDVYNYIRDLYFIGETVEAIHEDEWWEGKVIESFLEKAQTNGKHTPTDGDAAEKEHSDDELALDEPDLENIRYRIRLWDDETERYMEGDDGLVVVDTSRIRREKNCPSSINSDKCRLWLKYHCENTDGIWKVKQEFIEKYTLGEVKFSEYCCLVEPKFTASKIPARRKSTEIKRMKSVDQIPKEPKKKPTNGSSSKRTKEKNAAKQKERKLSSAERAVIKAALKKNQMQERAKVKGEMAAKLAVERAKLKEIKEQEKQKLREEKRIQADKIREWSKLRDDLVCDDLVPFPAVQTVPPELSPLFGDIILITEFLNTFGEHLSLEDQFPDGVSLDVLQNALLHSDLNGPFTDLLCFFLTAIFNCIAEEEAEEEEFSKEEGKKVEAEDGSSSGFTYQELIDAASAASQTWQTNHGARLQDFTLDSLNVTEILRVHLLTSGARGSSASTKFRYQSRGGYTSLDDAGLELKKESHSIVKALTHGNVFDLSPEDKLKILTTLIHQLLSYASLRDILDESMENLKSTKHELKQLQWGEQRREKEDAQIKQKRRLEQKLQQTSTEAAGEEKMETDEKSDEKHQEVSEEEKEKEAKKIIKRLLAETAKLDPKNTAQEASRTRRKNASDEFDWHEVDLIEWDTLDEKYMTEEEKEILHSRRKEIETRRKQEFLDKESELQDKVLSLQMKVGTHPVGKDRWGRMYWVFNALPGVYIERSIHEIIEQPIDLDTSTNSEKENQPEEEMKEVQEPKIELNVPHSLLTSDPSFSQDSTWVFYNNVSQYEQLIATLNSRGFRESPLKRKLVSQRNHIQKRMEENSDFQLISQTAESSNKPKAASTQPNIKAKSRISKGLVQNSSTQETIELNLREMLLDLDERITAGGLGSLKIPNRAAWREALENGAYAAQDKSITALVPAELEDTDVVVVKDLSRALLQILRSVEGKYLTTPLGDTVPTKKKSNKKKVVEVEEPEKHGRTMLERWTDSLLSCTSLSQIFLHMSSVESSIIWSKSALNARCRLCRRKGDGEKMLLCDECDRGHHMYCLKPPVKDVPRGDWFCPVCRPKQMKARRPSRRKSFCEPEEAETEEETEVEDAATETDDETTEIEENSADDADTASSSEEEPKHPKIKFLKGRGSGRSSPSSSLGGKKKAKGRSRTATPDLDRGRRSRAPSPESTGRRSKGAENRLSTEGRRSKASAESRLSQDGRRGSKRSLDTRPTSEPTGRSSLGGARGNVSEEVELMSQCESLIKELTDLEECWPFLAPVNRREVPDYYTVIKRPMDFQTVNSKIKMVNYTNVSEMLEDVRQIFKNCAAYNREKSSIYKSGEKLRALFEKRVKALKLDQSSNKKSRRN